MAPHRPALHGIATVITQPGESYVHPLVAASVAALILRARDGRPMRIFVPLVAASLGAIASHHAVKIVHRRPRPAVALRRHKTEAAFPSGHTTNATAVLATSGYLLVRERLAGAPETAALVAAVAMATGLSRVALGWHWGSDVAGGWLTGIAVAALSAELYEALSA
ncbi:MAG: phosphatase PAP2 family protein [bacterium]